MKKVCPKCFREFSVRPAFASQVYCSHKCSGDMLSKKYSKKVAVKCPVCHKIRELPPSIAKRTKCCSLKCMGIYRRGRFIGENSHNWRGGEITVSCQLCEKKFMAKPSHVKKGAGKYCSRKCQWEGQVRYTGHNIYSRCKRGKREDLNNMFFRSKWEANYARYLNLLISQKQIQKWEFEVDTFEFKKIKRGCRFYTPDFKVYNNDSSIEYHEIKGYMDAKSRTKLNRMAIYYPLVKYRLIMQREYNEIKNKLSGLIKNWE